MAANTSGYFWLNWNNGGWQGNTLVQAQPLNTGAGMVCTPGSINLNANGTYTFWTTIANTGPNSTYFNMQVSNS